MVFGQMVLIKNFLSLELKEFRVDFIEFDLYKNHTQQVHESIKHPSVR